MSVVKGKRKENDLQVIKELRELASHTIKCCGNESVFPKSKRWLYTQRITNEAIDALSCAVRANSIRVSEDDEDNTYRYRYMQQVEANAHLESLEVLLSFAYEILPVEGKRIEYWVGLIVSARTKLQAWIRADRKRYKK